METIPSMYTSSEGHRHVELLDGVGVPEGESALVVDRMELMPLRDRGNNVLSCSGYGYLKYK